MALALCLACGALGWLGSWTLLAGELPEQGSLTARLATVRHRMRRLVAALGGTRLVSMMLAVEPLRLMTRDVATWMGRPFEPWRERELAAVFLLVSLGICLVGGFLAQSPMGCVVSLMLEGLWIALRLSSKAERDRKELSQEMPGILRTLASALSSGNTLVQALDYVGLYEQGLAKEAFVRTSLRLRCGTSMEESLRLLEEELDAPGVGLMATALSISQRTGSPLRDLLQQSAVLVEQQEAFDRLLMVRTAQVRLSVRVVCSLPPLMVLLLSLLSEDFRSGIMSGPGMVCLAIAAAMDVVALLAIRHIMAGVSQ